MADETNVNEKPKKRRFSKLKYIIAFIFVNVIIFFAVTSQPKFEVSVEAVENSKTVDIKVVQKSLTMSLSPLQKTEIHMRLQLQKTVLWKWLQPILILCHRLYMKRLTR